MSGNKNDNDSAAAGMFGGGFIILLGLLFGLLVFVAIIVSLLYLFSLVTGKEFKILWDVYTPRKALVAFRNGIIGIVLVVAFTAFICGFYKLTFPEEWLLYLVAGGYSVGSLWLWLFYDDVDEPEPFIAPVQQTLPKPSSPAAGKPFEYASWDDERNAP